MKTESLGGSKYFLLLPDEYCRWSSVYFLKFKSDAFETFKKFKVLMEKHSGKYIKTLRTDRGGEFCSDEFNTHCEEHGILRELTAPHSPEQNGVAERKNQTVVEMARSTLKAKNLPNMFWGKAIVTAVYLLNLSPTKAVMNQTPYEAWQGRKPRVSHLKVFGCIAYALLENRSKLDDKSQKCIFIGYCTKSKAYRLYNPLSGKVIVSRNVIFNEEDRCEWTSTNNEAEAVEFADLVNEEVPATTRETETSSIESTPTSSPMTPSSSSPGSMSSKESPKKFKSLTDIYATCDFALYVSDPTSYKDVVDMKVWQVTMAEEMSAIERNETWEHVDLPKDKNVIGLKWVYRTKYNVDGSVQKHKARLVAKGYSQHHGIDYEETFSLVARFETVKTFLALVAQLWWPVYQFDVKSAFLNGELGEEVYVSQPEGFATVGHKVFKLKKALYGLKQAPRAWYSKIDTYFKEWI